MEDVDTEDNEYDKPKAPPKFDEATLKRRVDDVIADLHQRLQHGPRFCKDRGETQENYEQRVERWRQTVERFLRYIVRNNPYGNKN